MNADQQTSENPEISPKQYAEIDGPWKKIVTNFLQSFMELCQPDLAECIDWSKSCHNLNTELPKIVPESVVGKRLADMLFEVCLKNGEKTWVFMHLEVQAQKEADFEERMFTYFYLLYNKFKRPIVSIAILLDEYATWHPKEFVQRDPLLGRESLRFSFYPVKLMDYASKLEELRKEKNVFAFALRARLAVIQTKEDSEERKNLKLAFAQELRKLDIDEKSLAEWNEFLDRTIPLSNELMIKYTEELKDIVEDWETPYISTPQRAGMIQGRQEGRQEEIQNFRNSLERQIRRRFSHDVAERHLHLISQADSQTLSMWADNFVDAKNIDEVFEETCLAHS